MLVRTTLLTLTLLILLTGRITAQVYPVPPLLSQQGPLIMEDGTPAPSGTYRLRFSLWDAPTDGNEGWSQTLEAVTVEAGYYRVLLDVSSPTTLFYPDLWMQIQVNDGTPLVPRQPLASVAYAHKANLALTVPDGSITLAKLAPGLLDFGNLTGQVSSSQIANGAITGTKIADNAIATAHLQDGAVLGSKIADSTITTNKIANGAITLEKLNVDWRQVIQNTPSPSMRSHTHFGNARVIADNNAPHWMSYQNYGTNGTFRSLHRVRMTFGGMRIALSSFAWNRNNVYAEDVLNETGVLAPCRFLVSVECPAGADPVLLTWNGGQTSVTLPPNAWVVSDWNLDLNAAEGQDIAVRIYVDAGPNGLYVTNNYFSTGGTDSFRHLSNETLTKFWTGNQNGRGVIPALIMGNTAAWTAPVVGLLCDSLYPSFREGCVGTVASVLCGQPGDAARYYRQSEKHRIRTLMLQTSSHLVCNLGHNDLITNGYGYQQVQQDLLYVWRLYARMGIFVYQSTITPRTNSRDGWTTVAGQTVYHPVREQQRVIFNEWLRDGAPLDNALTLNPLPTGTHNALRAGQTGHPLMASVTS